MMRYGLAAIVAAALAALAGCGDADTPAAQADPPHETPFRVAPDDPRAGTALAVPDPVARERAARAAAGAREDGDLVPALVAALDDPDRHVRHAAADALGATGDPRAVEPLIAALARETTAAEQGMAAALGALGDARAVDPLVRALRDGDEELRRHAAEALVRLAALPDQAAAARAREALAGALDDPYPHVRAEALRGIQEVARVLAALEDEDWRVRAYAVRRLGALGARKATTALMGRLDPAVEPEAFVRAMVATALGAIGHREAESALGTAAETDPSQRVRDAARDALRALAETPGRPAQ